MLVVSSQVPSGLVFFSLIVQDTFSYLLDNEFPN